MSLLSKSTALTVYKTSHIPTEEDVLRGAFRPIDATSETLSYGFVNLDDSLDLTWEKSPPQKGAFMAFSFRIDTRRVPGAVVKKHLTQAMEQEKAARRERGDKPFIPKERKAEIKEQVLFKLLSKAEPIPAVHDVVVHMNTGMVFFACSSKKPKELFEIHWRTVFENALREQTPAAVTDNEDLAFTAGLFLTDIFENVLEHNDATFSIPAKATLSSTVEQAVTAIDAAEGADLLALSAPMADRRVTKASLLVLLDGEEYAATIRAEDFGISGLKTPKVQKGKEGDEPDAPFLEKVYLLTKFVAALYSAFLYKSPAKPLANIVGDDYDPEGI